MHTMRSRRLTFWIGASRTPCSAGMAAVSGGSRTLLSPGGAEKIPGQSVTLSFFNVLGVKPLAGRTFTAEDGRSSQCRGGERALLAQPLWQRTPSSSAASLASMANPSR